MRALVLPLDQDTARRARFRQLKLLFLILAFPDSLLADVPFLECSNSQRLMMAMLNSQASLESLARFAIMLSDSAADTLAITALLAVEDAAVDLFIVALEAVAGNLVLSAVDEVA